MDAWLKAALDYVPRWLEFQHRQSELPGVVAAVADKGKLAGEWAFGHADLANGIPLTPRHRFRVASHSKSFTAAGIMKLREQGKLALDHAVGRYVRGLHKSVASATIAQLLSHSAGIIRDGTDAGQWQDRRKFLNARELRAALKDPPVIEANTRFKYSNHGYGLLGLVIEVVTGTAYVEWIARAVVGPAGLNETLPDMPRTDAVRLARGHTATLLTGKRMIIPGDNPTNALAPATGFVSTARDMTRFFAQLDPAAKRSILSAASRREMIRRQWRIPHAALERHYGLGIISGATGGWEWFGHSGGFQGTVSQTAVLRERSVTVSVLTNASDGLAGVWLEGVIQIFRSFHKHGAPARRVRDWTGRWWGLWGAADLVPMGERVLVATPHWFNPFLDASEIVVTAKDRGRVDQANGFYSHGEAVRLVRDRRGRVASVWLAGRKALPEAEAAREIKARYASA
ncbi:MAG TPA: serine hydrolase domain-containing protein [Candidatus Cybelea sp.]|nr:serine hydrolase domain-containing protein [Candidatus Cybelea sp.]